MHAKVAFSAFLYLNAQETGFERKKEEEKEGGNKKIAVLHAKNVVFIM